MQTITFDRFDLGIDWRKGESVSDANRLREMCNAYVTTGLAAQKRPGLIKVATLEPGTSGLFAAGGQLHTFYGEGHITHADTRFVAHKVTHPKGEQALKSVPFVDTFHGLIYTAIEYEDGSTVHHYLDHSEKSAIEDEQCPHSPCVIKAASKLFATHNDVVRYCATGNPRNWTLENDAGFLPTGLNFHGDRMAKALGMYSNNLVVLSHEEAQIWQADPDPSAMRLMDIVKNVGTHFPFTVATVSGDLYFLSSAGFRSITTLQYTNSLADVDIGSPIDPLVKKSLQNLQIEPLARYYAGTGQYLCMLGKEVFVYSVSRTARIAAWSRYTLPFEVSALAEMEGTLYVRQGDTIWQFSEEAHADHGTPFEVKIETPWLDLKAPGQLKRLLGAEIIAQGACVFSVAFDEQYPNAITPVLRMRGNTRSTGRLPLSCTGRAFALRFQHQDNRPFRLDAVTLFYEPLGI